MSLPRTIGPYRVLGLLGQGGMGAVYRAEHPETRQTVALKTVKLLRQSTLPWLRREIHALARLRHPGIVRIREEGIEDGVPWYAMDLVEGVTLQQYGAALRDVSQRGPPEPETATLSKACVEPDAAASRSPGAETPDPRSAELRKVGISPDAGQPLTELLTVVRRLCVPLAYLHGEGIVHRDLKPSNVMVRADGAPVLLDLGLAARFAGASGRESLDTGREAAGTVAYMAPEQGRGEFVDARADLYALGCILYELLTGRPPFVGGTPTQVMWQHFEKAPAPPSSLAAGVPETLDRLVLRLLAKDPAHRFGHALDVAARLAALGAGESRDPEAPQPRAYLYRPGLCGRDEALAQIEGHIARLEAGSGALVLIAGESGIGKTRLVLEVARDPEHRRLRVLTGECLDVGGAPLQSLQKPLQAIADRCREWGQDETLRLLGPRGKLLALYEPAFAELAGLELYPEPAELPLAAAVLRLYGFLAETFTALAQGAPLLLVLDDLQWADDLTLGWLAFLLRRERLARMRLLILGTVRSEASGKRLQELCAFPGVARIDLQHLGEDSVRLMLGDMLALQSPPVVFSRFLTRRTEGNPFFVAEVLRAAIETGLLARDPDGSWQIATPTTAGTYDAIYEALPLPHSLQALLVQRLQNLPQRARELCEVAAVFGREAQLPLVGAVGALAEDELLEALGELQRRQVLEAPAPGTVRFVHDKIREMAHAGIQPDRLVGLHRGAAQQLEAQGSPAQLASLGHHWEQARESSKARGAYLAAARKAMERYAHADAERLYQAYLRLVETPSPESVQARNELGWQVLHVQGRNQEAIELQQLAAQEAQRIGDHTGEARSLHHLGSLHRGIGQLEAARSLGAEAVDLARKSGDRLEEGRALLSLANSCHVRGQMDEARGLYEQALAIARETQDWRTLEVTLGNLGNMHVGQGRLEEARRLFEQVLGLPRKASSRRSEGLIVALLAVVHYQQGRLEEARSLYQHALAIAGEVGSPQDKAHTLVNLALLEQAEGRLDEALSMYEEALGILREVGDRINEGTTLENLAGLCRQQGRIEEARSFEEQAQAIARQTGGETRQS